MERARGLFGRYRGGCESGNVERVVAGNAGPRLESPTRLIVPRDGGGGGNIRPKSSDRANRARLCM